MLLLFTYAALYTLLTKLIMLLFHVSPLTICRILVLYCQEFSQVVVSMLVGSASSKENSLMGASLTYKTNFSKVLILSHL